MTFDHQLILLKQDHVQDDIGNWQPVLVPKPVLCALKSVTRNEFYSAAQAGLRPERVFVIHGYEYEGEQEVEFEGERYRVVRTYSVSFEELELTCEKVVTNSQ